MLRALLVLAISAPLLSGCADPATSPPAAPIEDVDTAIAGENVTLLARPFLLSAGAPLTATFEVPPAGAGRPTSIRVQMDQGVWQGLDLSGLSGCGAFGRAAGLMVSMGTNNGSGAATCQLEPGTHELTLALDRGAATGRLLVWIA